MATINFLGGCPRTNQLTRTTVSTSNVADSVGLLPLLQSLRGITTPNGYLLTQTLRSYQYSSCIDEYLNKNLTLSPEFHASVLGWRCVGHEGDLKPENGDVQFIFPNIPEIVLATSKKKNSGLASRCERNLLWTPASGTNAPLDLSGDNSVKQIVGHLRSEIVQLPFVGTRLCRFRPSWMQAHILTLLPMFLLGVHAEESIVEKKEEIAELMDLVKCLRLGDASGLSLITVHVPDNVMRGSFEASHRIVGQVELVALVCSDEEIVPYWALFNEYDEDNASWSISWFMKSSRLANETTVYIQAAFSIIMAFKRDEIEVRTVDPEKMSSGMLHRMKHNTSASMLHGRLEDRLEWIIPVKVSDIWWEAIAHGKSFHAKVTGNEREFQIGVGRNLAMQVTFSLPGPVSSSGIRLQLSRKRRLLTCLLKKGKYDLQSLLPASTFIDDQKAWLPPSPLHETFLTTISGMQMSREEKFIARSSNPQQCPPLVALKDTFIFFLQLQEEDHMTLALKKTGARATPDVQALVIHHGLRRNHRDGVPAADLSICFLEPQFVTKVAPWFMRRTAGKPARHILCTTQEIYLMKQFVKVFSSHLKDSGEWKTTPAKARIKEEEIQERFTRILLPPMFSPTIDNFACNASS